VLQNPLRRVQFVNLTPFSFSGTHYHIVVAFCNFVQVSMQRYFILFLCCLVSFPPFYIHNCCTSYFKRQLYHRLKPNFSLQGQSQMELYEKHHNTADGRIRVWFGIRQIMNSTDRLLLETRNTAQELKTGIHMVLNFLFTSELHLYCKSHADLLSGGYLRALKCFIIRKLLKRFCFGLEV